MWISVTEISGSSQLVNLANATKIIAISKGTRIYFSKTGATAVDWDFTDVKEPLSQFVMFVRLNAPENVRYAVPAQN